MRAYEFIFEEDNIPEMIDGRPTRNSQGKLIHHTIEGIRNFWKWFGDSKVVDDQSRPLVVYHGTDKDFYSFDTKDGKKTGKSSLQLDFGSHFTADRNYALQYAKNGYTMSVYLKLLNPLNLADPHAAFQSIDQSNYTNIEKLNKLLKIKPVGDNFYDSNGKKQKEQQNTYINAHLLNTKSPSIVKSSLIEAGFDGIIYNPYGIVGINAHVKHPISYIALSPSQLKSAIGNNGQFSKSSNITESLLHEQSEQWKRSKEKGLDMSFNARMQRAKKMGFDVDHKWYHGTHADIAHFKNKKGAHLGFHFGDFEAANTRLEDTFIMDDNMQSYINYMRQQSEMLFKELSNYEDELRRKDAEIPPELILKAIESNDHNAIDKVFTDHKYVPTKEEESKLKFLQNRYKKSQLPIHKFGIGSNIQQVFLRLGNSLRLPDVGDWGTPTRIRDVLPWDSDARTLNEIKNEILAKGFDSIIYQNRVENPVLKTDSVIVLHPAQIRSIHAAFDPDYQDSSDILA